MLTALCVGLAIRYACVGRYGIWNGQTMRLCDLESDSQSIRKKEGVSIPIQLHYISIPAAKASVDVAIVRPAPRH